MKISAVIGIALCAFALAGSPATPSSVAAAVKTTALAPRTTTGSGQTNDDAANGPYPGYYTWPEVKDKVAEWQRKYPGLIQVSSLGKTYEGRDIVLLRLSAAPTTATADTPEVMLLSGIHPREQQPIIGIVRLVDEILAGYGKDPRFTNMLRNRVVWIVPIFNVDGKVYDMQHGNGTTRGADWRKNREPNPDGTIGTDLNRNFGVRWGGARAVDPLWQTSTTVTKAEIYEGRSPDGEPETKDLTAFLEAHKAHLRAFLDLHSPLHEINLPGYAIGPEYDRYMSLVSAMRAGQQVPYKVSPMVRDGEPPPGARGGDSGITYTWAFYTQGIYALNLEFAPPIEAKSGVRARYAPPAEIEAEYTHSIREPLLTFIEKGGALPPSHAGSAVCAPGAGTFSGPLVPGATVSWTPPAITGPWTCAILVGESAGIEAPSEYRRAPMTSGGFTLQVDETAKPGTVVPMTLYLWDSERGESTAKFLFTVATPP